MQVQVKRVGAYLAFLYVLLRCVIVVPGPNGDLAGGGFSMMMLMLIGWLVIATALFLLRPASLRRQSNEKPSGMVGVDCSALFLCSLLLKKVCSDAVLMWYYWGC